MISRDTVDIIRMVGEFAADMYISNAVGTFTGTVIGDLLKRYPNMSKKDKIGIQIGGTAVGLVAGQVINTFIWEQVDPALDALEDLVFGPRKVDVVETEFTDEDPIDARIRELTEEIERLKKMQEDAKSGK